MLTKSEYIDFIIEQLPRYVEGFIKVEQSKKYEEMNPLHLDVFYEVNEDQNCIVINLSNNWEQYESSGGKSEVISSLLNSVAHLVNQGKELHEFDITKKKESLFPAVRHMLSLEEQMKQFPADVPSLSLPVADLVMLFFFNFEDYMMGVNSFQYQEGFESNEIVEHAFSNVEKKGWVPERHKVDLKSGKVLIYQEDDPFNYQFFNTKWVEEHLGDNFYFSLPTRQEALVYIPNKNYRTKDFLNDRHHFIQDTVQRFSKSPSFSISSSIYSFRKGEYGTIPFGK